MLEPKKAVTKKSATKKAAPKEAKSRVAVSELNLRKTASRLLASTLVSTELDFIQRELGSTATQEDMDAKVIAVRSMPWASIVQAD